ncbi:MAG: hypothetical protein ACK5SX_13475 [Sandaracinobacter sp.]
MTARFDNLVQVPLFGIVAILVSSLTLLVATGPAVAAVHGVQAAGSLQTPPAEPRGANAS